MRLIVTRPEPMASRTAAQLKIMGHDVAISPVLSIENTGEAIPECEFSTLIVSSANALRVLQQRGIYQELLQKPIYVVGDATAAFARKTGFTDVHSASGSWCDLANLLEDELSPTQGPETSLLYICGRNITTGLTGKLENSGFRVVNWPIYSAILVEQLTKTMSIWINDDQSTGILLYSARSADQLVKLLVANFSPHQINLIDFYAISNKVRNALPGNLRHNCLVSSKPDEASLFEMIEQTSS